MDLSRNNHKQDIFNNNGSSNNYIDRLKFKYAEYLIGNFKNSDDLIDYIKSQFKTNDISKDRKQILSLDRFGFIRQNFYNSSINNEKRINRNDLTIHYFIIKESNLSNLYLEEDKLDIIYVAICEELNSFDTNSILLEQELKLYQGVSEFDIKNNTLQLKEFLEALEKEELTKKIKYINPDFITPEEKKLMLEEYIMDQLKGI